MCDITCMAEFNSPLYGDLKFRDRLGAFFISEEWRTFLMMENGECCWIKAANDDE